MPTVDLPIEPSPVVCAKFATVARRYDWLWDRIMGGTPGIRAKGRLLVFEGPTASGYRPERNELHVVLGRHDLDDVPEPEDVAVEPSPPSPAGWPSWERELHHEFVHECQDKVVQGGVSDEGRQLEAGPDVRRFDGEGHDATFYTAAGEIARALGFEARAFVNAL